MANYPSAGVRRIDAQFTETTYERTTRLREARVKKNREALWNLIADLSSALVDEGPGWSNEGVHSLRRRVANALPPAHRPEWLAEYADPAVVQS